MADAIRLRGLQLLAFCGVLPEEIDRRQPFEVDLTVEVDLAAAGRTDALEDTIDYGALADTVVELAEARRYSLLERFATDIAEVVLAADDRITFVEVRLDKMRPPVPHQLDRSGVTIRRSR